MGEMDLKKAEYYTNRELSWLGFNNRILGEARDASLPLFERLKFLSITASNLDEFFMVRVASLKDQVHAGYHKTDIAGMTAKEQLKEISVRTHELVHVQYNTLNRSLIPALEKAGMHLVYFCRYINNGFSTKIACNNDSFITIFLAPLINISLSVNINISVICDCLSFIFHPLIICSLGIV